MMNTVKHVAIVSAGLSTPSSTTNLANLYASSILRQTDSTATVQLIEVRDLAHDIVDAMLTCSPGSRLQDAIDQVTSADALIAVTPIFNGAVNGLFKSFIDVIEPERLAGKTVALGATGGSIRHTLAIEHSMRPLFSYVAARTVPTSVFVTPVDTVESDEIQGRVDRAVAELLAFPVNT